MPPHRRRHLAVVAVAWLLLAPSAAGLPHQLPAGHDKGDDDNGAHASDAAAGSGAQPTQHSNCRGVTVRGGSDAVLSSVHDFSAEIAGLGEAERAKLFESTIFGQLLAKMLAAAEGAGTDSSGDAGAHMVTVQVGANNGKQNDPFHKQLVLGDGISRQMLRHWVPIMFEPAPRMYASLRRHWELLAKARTTACFVTSRRPVRYPDEGICPFYYFNNSHRDGDKPICKSCLRCEDHEKYMKEQLGTLDRQAMVDYFQKNFERCIASEPLACGPLRTVLNQLEWAPESTPRMDVLHIDAEGFDGNIIHGVLDDPNEVPPPVIFLEAKVMRARVRKPTKDAEPYSCEFFDLFDRLDAMGRVLVYNGGEDALSMASTATTRREWTWRDPSRCVEAMKQKFPESWGVMKDTHHPTQEDKAAVWAAVQECCGNVYRIPF